MKKLLTIFLLTLTAYVALGQETPTKTVVTPPAKEPTINGKPYSQWVAEQKAIQQQKKNSQNVAQNANAPVRGTNLTDMPVIDAVPVQPVKQEVSNSVTNIDQSGFDQSKVIQVNAAKNMNIQKPKSPVIMNKTNELGEDKKLPPVVSEKSVTSTKTQPEISIPSQEADIIKLDAVTAKPTVVEVKKETIPTIEGGATGNNTAKSTGIDPSSKQSPENIVVTEKEKANLNVQDAGKSKPSVVESQNMNVNKKTSATTTEKPQVPSQFQLPSNVSWNPRLETVKPENSTQSVNSISTKHYSSLVLNETKKAADDKPVPAKPDAIITKTEVKTTEVKAIQKPVEQPVNVKGTSLDPNAVSSEKTANFTPGQEVIAPATQKPAVRNTEPEKTKQPAVTEAKKNPAGETNTTNKPAIPPAAGGGQ